jgi:hypothetical protein
VGPDNWRIDEREVDYCDLSLDDDHFLVEETAPPSILLVSHPRKSPGI